MNNKDKIAWTACWQRRPRDQMIGMRCMRCTALRVCAVWSAVMMISDMNWDALIYAIDVVWNVHGSEHWTVFGRCRWSNLPSAKLMSCNIRLRGFGRTSVDHMMAWISLLLQQEHSDKFWCGSRHTTESQSSLLTGILGPHDITLYQ